MEARAPTASNLDRRKHSKPAHQQKQARELEEIQRAGPVSITYRGEKFAGYNKAKRTPGHKTKSHAVLAKEGDQIKLIRFGQQGVQGAGKNPKTASEKARRKSFKARHAKNISKGKMSAAYWADRSKW